MGEVWGKEKSGKKIVWVYIYIYISVYSSQSIDISDDELSNLIDSILKEDDLNLDGYIDYYEFVQAQRRNRGEP